MAKTNNVNADYQTYTVKIFCSVPPKTALVTQSMLTGETGVKASGFRITAPWKKGKFVMLSSFSVDYPAKNYRTKDGLEISVDVSLKVHVEDPVKFEFDINNPRKELEVLTQAIIRDYVANETYESLIKEKFSLSNPDNQWILDRFKDFQELSGASVDGMNFQNIELADPETKRQFEAARSQERENAEIIARAKAEAEAAVTKAEAQKKTMQTNMQSVDEFIKIMKEKGHELTSDQIMELYKMVTTVNSQNPNVKTHAFVNGTGSSIENSAAILTDGDKSLSFENSRKK